MFGFFRRRGFLSAARWAAPSPRVTDGCSCVEGMGHPHLQPHALLPPRLPSQKTLGNGIGNANSLFTPNQCPDVKKNFYFFKLKLAEKLNPYSQNYKKCI